MNLELLSEFNNWLGEHIVRRSFWLKVGLGLMACVVIAGIAVYFWPDQTKAASAGPRFATASGDCTNDTSAAGTISWTSPGNAFSDNATNATVALDGTTSEYLKCTNFGFTSGMIPSGAVINGIVVTIERSVNSSANLKDSAVRIVKGGTIGSTDRSTATAYTTSMVAEDHGGASDLWGETWSDTDVTASNFGVALSSNNSSSAGGAETVSVDYISITVYYTEPSWTTITQRQGVITNDQNNTVLASHTAKIGERMRVLLQVDTNAGGSKNSVFKLQYDKNSSGSWVDVAPGNEIRPARSSIKGLDKYVGTGIAGTCTGGVTAGKGFVFEDTASTTSIPINGSGCHDIGFVVDTNNAVANTTYRFRLYDLLGGATLNTYSAYASFTTVASGSDIVRGSKSNVTSLASTQSDLKTLLDNQGYSNIDTDNAAREIIQSVANDSTADFTTTGGATGDFFGSSVYSAGDVNGDGYADVIVGSEGYSTNTGRAYIFYGGASMDTTADVTMTGEATNAYFGNSVGSAGDVNGDGYADVVVGSERYSSSTGRAYIFYGGASMDNTADVTMTGAGAGWFSSSVSGAGDVNGDGYSDVAVGERAYSSSTGRAYIFYGGSSMDNTADVTMTGSATSTQFGGYLGSAGDVNGDGYSDVVVGAIQYSTFTGRAYIFYGGASMDNTADVTMTGEATNNFFGAYSTGAGDVNGDGYADVIISAYGYSSTTGRVYIYYGGSSMNNTADVTISGGVGENTLGYSIGAAGDMNGDGYADVVVGNLGNNVKFYYGGSSMDNTVDVTFSGSSYNSVTSAGDVNGDGHSDLVIGNELSSSNTGLVSIHYLTHQMDSTADKTMNSEAVGGFGYAVASAGDVNGDGYEDALVGAYNYSTATGRAYIYYGGVSMDTTTADVTMTGEATSNLFGYSLSGAGDVNGDGYDDVAVGAYGYTSQTGRAYIYYGGASMDGTADVTMTGGATSNLFGVTVSDAGDVNGDGYDDVVVGAYGYSTSTGRAYVFYGGSSMDNTADVTMTGEAANNFFGRAVSDVGDVNGDGYDDVAVGATGYNPGGASGTGRAYVFYGGSSMDNTADVTMTGEAASSSFGTSISGDDDVNGDGYDDVVISAYGYSTSTGRAYVFYGGSSMDNTADVTMTGTSDSYFGTEVSMGDVNGDGYADVMSSGFDEVAFDDTGFVNMYYGGPAMDATADIIMTGEAIGDQFGSTVDGQGDFNNDGYKDIFTGAVGGGTSGRAYVFNGGSSSYTPTYNLAQKHSDVCSGLTSIDGSWNGQSSVAASTNNLLLQVYRFGSTNAWETVDTESSLAANTDGTLNGSKTTNLDEYCDGSNWSYWRLYQASGTQTLQTDDFDITFSGGGPTPTPTPAMDQRLKGGNWWMDGVRQFLHLD